MFTVVAFSAGLSELSYKSVSYSRISVEKVLLDMKLKEICRAKLWLFLCCAS